jgi:hypothetical protein
MIRKRLLLQFGEPCNAKNGIFKPQEVVGQAAKKKTFGRKTQLPNYSTSMLGVGVFSFLQLSFLLLIFPLLVLTADEWRPGFFLI